METKAKRTLVKSAPELWELTDDLVRMETWMGGIVGSPIPVEIEITDACRSVLVAEHQSAGNARMRVALAESGFGTAVEITAQNPGGAPRERHAGKAPR